MFHHYDVALNSKGGPTADVIIRAFNVADDSIAVMFADENSTPIESLSGIPNAAKSSADGNYDFFIADGFYNLRFYIGDALINTVHNIQLKNTISAADVEGKAQATALGVEGDADDLGSFTAGIIPSGQSAKEALQSVETAINYLALDSFQYDIDVYTFENDPTGGGPVASQARVIDSAGTHSKPRYGHHIHVNSDGSGIAAGPASADFSFGVTAIRTEWQTNDTPGEIDGIGVVAINGVGDVAGVLVDVGSREGFSAVLEGASRQYLPDGSATHKLRVQLGVVDSLTDTQLGIAIVADTGINDVAVYAASGGGTFSKMLQFIQAGITTFQIDPDGSYWSTGNAVIGLNVGTDDVGTTIGLGRTADGNSYHDLVTDTTYTDFGARFGRNAGANGTTIIGHRGTGALQMKLYEAGNFLIEIDGSTFFGVESDGAIVMGAHTPAADAPSNGYIEIKDRLGNVHKLSTRA